MTERDSAGSKDPALRTEVRGVSLGQTALPLQPIADDAWPEKLSRLRTDFAGRLTVYRVMAHHPDLVLAWERFRNHIVLANALGRERSEVVILRTAHRWESIYEWSHHVVRARAAGLTDERIESLRRGLEAMAPADAALAGAVDELIDSGRLRAETTGAVHALVGKEGLLDLMATVGMYSTLAFIVNSFDTPIDA